jgi:hypothetical protein
MKRNVHPSVAALALLLLAGAPAGIAQQQEQFPLPTPLDDPYMPPAGDPDPFAPDGD